jgi:hypothetical protein
MSIPDHISEILETIFFWVTILKFFGEKIWIRDGKNADPQHCIRRDPKKGIPKDCFQRLRYLAQLEAVRAERRAPLLITRPNMLSEK